MFIDRKTIAPIESLISFSASIKENKETVVDFEERCCDHNTVNRPRVVLPMADFFYNMTELDAGVRNIIRYMDRQWPWKGKNSSGRPVSIVPVDVFSGRAVMENSGARNKIVSLIFQNIFFSALSESSIIAGKKNSGILDTGSCPAFKRNSSLLASEECQNSSRAFALCPDPFDEIDMYSAAHKHCDCFSEAVCHVDEQTSRYRMVELLIHAKNSFCHSVRFIFSPFPELS
jgi:hypothetical protein